MSFRFQISAKNMHPPSSVASAKQTRILALLRAHVENNQNVIHHFDSFNYHRCLKNTRRLLPTIVLNKIRLLKYWNSFIYLLAMRFFWIFPSWRRSSWFLLMLIMWFIKYLLKTWVLIKGYHTISSKYLIQCLFRVSQWLIESGF